MAFLFFALLPHHWLHSLRCSALTYDYTVFDTHLTLRLKNCEDVTYRSYFDETFQGGNRGGSPPGYFAVAADWNPPFHRLLTEFDPQGVSGWLISIR